MPFHGNRKGQAPYSGSLSFSTVVAGYTKIEGVLVDRCLTKDGDAAEEARKAEAESVLKKLLAGGMSADEILAKLK